MLSFGNLLVFSAVYIVLWPQGWHALVPLGWLVLSVAIALITLRRRMAQRRYALLPGSEIEITIDDDAISTDGKLAKPEVICWKNVTSAYHSSSNMIITLEGGSIRSIPERAFDGEWPVFWHELRTHLTGARYLILGILSTNRWSDNSIASDATLATYWRGLAQNDNAISNKAQLTKDLNEWYLIAHTDFVTFDTDLYLRLAQGLDTVSKDQNKQFLSSLSESERSVVRREGGSTDWNERNRPCHVSKTTTSELSAQTWFYCRNVEDLSSYRIIYSFRNRKLVAVHQP